MTGDPPLIHTIGHGGCGFDEVTDRLGAHGVQTIVDVRSVPYSSDAPDFTKHALEDECAAAGLGYRYLGDRLGGLSPATSPGDESFDSAIVELLGLAATSHVVLLCSEIDPDGCHRDAVLAPALEERGVPVVHILGDGTVAPHQPRLSW